MSGPAGSGPRPARSGSAKRAQRYRQTLQAANLLLLVLYPLSWFAPLVRAGLLPLFGLSEISIMSGLGNLWQSDIVLWLLVTTFAIIAPLLKTLVLALVQAGLLGRGLFPLVHHLGRLAMADVFLIALYITLSKGVGLGRVEPAWGLYLFTGCVLASILVAWASEKYPHNPPD